jgi:preprotein translocase subunit SecG
MFTIILIVHLVLCLFLVGSILLQRSEGGALGIGGGPSGMMSGRSATNFMTRVTQVLGAAFFLTSVGLSLIAANSGTKPATSVMGSDAATSNEIPLDKIDLSAPVVPGAAKAPAADGAPAPKAPTGGLLALPATPAEAPSAPAESEAASEVPAQPAEKK